MIGSARRIGLYQDLSIPDRYKILMVLALGKPVETIVTEPLKPDREIRYYRDAEGVHHVPKRNLDDLIVHDA